jgi:hypothetical protein
MWVQRVVDRAQNRGPSLELLDTCVAVVVLRHSPFRVSYVTAIPFTHVAAFIMKHSRAFSNVVYSARLRFPFFVVCAPVAL